MKYIFLLCISFLILSVSVTVRGSNGDTDHSLSLHISYVRVKDQFNYGLSFGGLNLAGNYEMSYHAGNLDLNYNAEVSMGAVRNKGVGVMLRLKPIDGFAGFRLISESEKKLLLGPYFSAYFMWQLYPELQSGHLFWISSYESGPRLRTTLPLKKYKLRISASMAFAAINSRPEYQTEQYYYSSTFSDFFRNPHTNMQVRFPGSFNHVDLFVELEPPHRKISFGYRFEYIGYRDVPSFQYMSHTLLLRWKIATQKP
jgi:hypothetical protein